VGSNPDKVIGFFFFCLPNPSGRTMALGLTQPLTGILGGGGHGHYIRVTILLPYCLDNVGSLTSHNPIGLHGLLLG
jgi:hypothetical protein